MPWPSNDYRKTYSGEPDPLILIVPGLNDSGPDHWQTALGA